MAWMYEYYNTGRDSELGDFYGDNLWQCQTFTVGTTGPNVNHNITSVKLLLSRQGEPGTLYVSIKATDEAGKPTGGDLSTGTTNGNTLPEYPGIEWREVTMSSYTLLANTKYAIVVRLPNGDEYNLVFTGADITSPAYTGGSWGYTSNGGTSWTMNTAYDIMFEIWSDTEPPAGTNMKVNISDVFKDISEIKINIGDVWKAVTKIQVNIGDVWKTVFG